MISAISPAAPKMQPLTSDADQTFSLAKAAALPVGNQGAVAQVNLCAGPHEPDPSTFAHLAYLTTFGMPDYQRNPEEALEVLREQMTTDPRGNIIFAVMGNEVEDFGLQNLSEFIRMAHAEGLVPEGTTLGIAGYYQPGRTEEMRDLARELNMTIAFDWQATEHKPPREEFRQFGGVRQTDVGAYVIRPDGSSGYDMRADVDYGAHGSRCATEPKIVIPE